MSNGITRVFSKEGKDFLASVVDKILPEMTRAQRTLARKEAEDQVPKKFIKGWRIRPWVINNGNREQLCETYDKFEEAKKRLSDIENQVEKSSSPSRQGFH